MDPMGLFPAPLDSHEIVQAMEMNPLHSHDSKVHQWQFPKRHIWVREKQFSFKFNLSSEKWASSGCLGLIWGMEKNTRFMGIIPSHHKDHLDSPGGKASLTRSDHTPLDIQANTSWRFGVWWVCFGAPSIPKPQEVFAWMSRDSDRSRKKRTKSRGPSIFSMLALQRLPGYMYLEPICCIQKKVFSNQNKGHLGSRCVYIIYINLEI